MARKKKQPPVPVPVTPARQPVSGAVASSQSGAWIVSSRPDLPASPFGVTAANFSSFTVPAGQYLVIETLSIQVDVMPPGKKIAAFVNYKCGGNSVIMFVPLTFSYTGTVSDFYVATQAVRLYADPGTVVSLSTFASSGGTAGTPFLTVSGYLI